jgi:protein-L-isoaspartate(D-aspartate) O-methyltransferase
MQRVPRHEFVGLEYEEQAYEDHPIPIGSGQTVSQPYIVAAMLESLALKPEHIVLEVGTGSGYQSALLSELVSRVYTIERHPPLAEDAQRRLERLGYRNVMVFPDALFQQLREGGRMILPVGTSDSQELYLVRKQDGRQDVARMEACRFVPLIGSQGFTVE